MIITYLYLDHSIPLKKIDITLLYNKNMSKDFYPDLKTLEDSLFVPEKV